MICRNRKSYWGKSGLEFTVFIRVS